MSCRVYKTQILKINRSERKRFRRWLNLLHEVTYLRAETEMSYISAFMADNCPNAEVKVYCDYGYAVIVKPEAGGVYPTLKELIQDKRAQEEKEHKLDIEEEEWY